MVAVYRRANILVGVAVVLGLTTALTPLAWDTLHAPRGYQRVALDQLGRFSLDDERGTTQDVPQAFRMLDGKRVVTVGKMWSPAGVSDVSRFQLVYDLVQHRPAGPPRVQERIFARMRPGNTAILQGPYDAVQVYGTLHVHLNRNDEGVITSVYDMDVDRVAYPPEPEPAAWWTGGAAVTGLISLLALVDCLVRLHVHRAREMVGRCRECGYDLRASQERCPECGTPIPLSWDSLFPPTVWTPTNPAPEQ